VATLQTVALRLKQHGRELYQFSLSAGRIHDLIASGEMDIDRWSPEKVDGYQRTPTESRFKKYGKYVAVAKGVSPTSLLLSLRDKEKLDVEDTNEGNAVRLQVDLRGSKLYVPDGQHRAFGLKWAVDEYAGEVEDYEVPVVLFIADGPDPKYEEAQQFYTINNFAKRVRTDLAQRYLLRQKEQELGGLDEQTTIPADATLKDLEPYGVKVADLLNASGPLKERIAPPNVEAPGAPVKQTSFVDSIKPLLQTASKLRWDIGKTKEILEAFWAAVSEKCPEAWTHWSNDPCGIDSQDHFNAVLATTTGVYSLNDLLNRTMLLPDVARAPTEAKTFKALLSRPGLEDPFFVDGPEGFWSSEDSAP
jgi:DGQHR domain-containing protein